MYFCNSSNHNEAREHGRSLSCNFNFVFALILSPQAVVSLTNAALKATRAPGNYDNILIR